MSGVKIGRIAGVAAVAALSGLGGLAWRRRQEVLEVAPELRTPALYLPLALFAWRRAWPVSAEERLWAWILFAFGLYRWLEEPGNGQALLWGLTAMTFARAIHAAHRTTAAARPIAPR